MVHLPSRGLQMWEGRWGLGLRSLYYGRDQIIDGVLAQLILQWAHADLSGVITLVPDWITEIEILGKKQILYIIPFPWIKAFLLRRTKKKPLQLTSFHTSKIVQQNQYRKLWGTAENRISVKDLGDAELKIPSKSSIYLPMCLVQNPDG